jgi:hypothetical protein
MHPHLNQLHRALRDEHRHQRGEYDRIAKRTLADRVAAGHCWHPITVEEAEPGGRAWFVTVCGTLHDGLRAGDAIRLHKADGTGVSGRCLDATPERA